MTLKNTNDSWAWPSRFFHWTIVVLILVQAVTGLFGDDLPRGTITFHKSIGVTILALAVLRLLWRLYAGKPADLPMPRWQALSAHALHGMLYVMLFVVPLSGWAMSSAGGRAVQWFGLITLPALTGADDALHERLEDLHGTLFWVLAALAIGHVAAAIYHHVVLKDRTLARMLGGRTAP